MTELALIDGYCEAHGHPSECSEPAPGYVKSTSSTNITVTIDGVTKEVSSLAASNIFIPEHCHVYLPPCDDCYAHDGVDPSYEVAKNITINGSPARIVLSDVGKDPGTSNAVDIEQNQEENQQASSGTTMNTKRTVSATETITA